MQLAELITAIAAHAATEQGRAELTAAIQRDVQPVYQAIFAAGDTAAATRFATERTALESRATAAEQDRDNARTRVSELEKSKETPDVAQLREQHARDLAQVRTDSETRENTLKGTLAAERQRNALAELRRELAAAGVDPFMADALVERPSTAARLRFADADGVLGVLQQGSETITLQVGSDSTPLRVYAAELKGALDPKWLTSNVAAGPGNRADFTPARTTSGGYDPAAEGKKLGETQAARTAPDANSLALR